MGCGGGEEAGILGLMGKWKKWGWGLVIVVGLAVLRWGWGQVGGCGPGRVFCRGENEWRVGVQVVVEKEEYRSEDEVVRVKVMNDSGRRLRVYTHYPEMEKYEVQEKEWKVVENLYGCPCEAICDFAPWVAVEPGEEMGGRWNLKEERCEVGGTATASNRVGVGNYRVKVEVGPEEGERGEGAEVVYSEPFRVKG